MKSFISSGFHELLNLFPLSFPWQFELIQLQYKIHCTRCKNDKKLDHIFAVLLISYYGESYGFF